MMEIVASVLRYLTLSEQSVYLRLWHLSHGEGKDRCAIGYQDLAKLAHVSLSTLKRVLKKLIAPQTGAGRVVHQTFGIHHLCPPARVGHKAWPRPDA